VSGASVVVLGDVMTDVIARVAEPLAVGSDTAARIALRPGGSAANTAAWLGRLGVPVVFVGCVGDDAFGRDAHRALRASGVAPSLAVTGRAASGACVILVDRVGERTMLPDAGANAHLGPEDLPTTAFEPGGHLHVSGYALLRPGSRDAALAALERARATGMTTSVDPASAAPLAALGAGPFRTLVRGVGLMIVTLDEGEVLCGSRDPVTLAGDLLADHHEVVVKLGSLGASWHDVGGASVQVPPATPTGPVVDSTGAGDAFAAALLAARHAGEPPRAALERACTLAARVVTQAGARPV
jgi:sugar/nucleoside kinase (ribokinase family)